MLDKEKILKEIDSIISYQEGFREEANWDVIYSFKNIKVGIENGYFDIKDSKDAG